MKKWTKVWLVIAASLVVIGLIMFSVVMWAYQWDFAKLYTGKYETNTYEINEEFHNLSIKTDTADIIFAVSDNGNCKVECYEEKKAKHSVAVQEDALIINLVNKKSWYDHIGIHFGSPSIKVYLSKAEYAALSIKESTGDIEIPKEFKFESVDVSLSTGDVGCFASTSKLTKIKTSTGNIRVENMSTGDLALSTSTGGITVSDVICEGDATVNVTTGKTNLTDVRCKNIISDGDTGSIFLNNVIAAETFTIERSTGDVKFDGSDAAEIFVETDTGDVTGSFLTDKVYITQTDTGRIQVPKTVTGGKCEISTDTGDIKITIVRP